jgi:hypothetical protein
MSPLVGRSAYIPVESHYKGWLQMAMPVLSPPQVDQLSSLVAQYISNQRTRYLPTGVPLSTQQKTAMAGFFTSDLLDEVRWMVLVGEWVANPDFYPMLVAIGFTNLPDQPAMAAVTFFDVVVAHVRFTDALLFHQLVHVEQYRQLGIPRFADLYVRGFLNGGGYDGIPLERNAYMLGDQYALDPAKPFSVAEVVADWISEERF